MIKHPQISDMRHRLALERPERTAASGGGVTVSYVKLADIWASITPLNMKERLTRDQMRAAITHQIIIRYRADVLPEMRLTSSSRIFEILSVLNEKERNRWLLLECEEIPPESAA